MKTWAKWTIGVSCSVAVVTAIAVPVGLYLSGYWDTYKQITYKVDSGLFTKTRNANQNISVFDPNYNKDAQEKLQALSKSLSTTDLQRDFNRVLTDFYEAYESKTAQSETEIEDIRVKSKNNDGSFELSVKYEIEKKGGNEQTKFQTISWTPKFTVLTDDDVNSIKQQIEGFKNNKTNGVDLEDIKEIFLGEKEKDDPDDYGIFDRVAKLNKEYNGFAGIVAYDLSISDIFDKLEKPTPKANPQVTKETRFRIPSLSLNNGQSSVALTPDKQPIIKIDFNNSHLNGITEQELVNLPQGKHIDKTKISEISKFVFGSDAQSDQIQDIEIDAPDLDGFVKLSVHFIDKNNPTEVFYLYVSKPSTPNPSPTL